MGILSERIEHQVPQNLDNILYYYSASLSVISIVPNVILIFHFCIFVNPFVWQNNMQIICFLRSAFHLLF